MLKLNNAIVLAVLLGSTAAVGAPLSPEFTPVFDGKSLGGFTRVGAAQWTVENGELKAAAGPGLLKYNRAYQDGRIKFRFKCASCATGLIIRADQDSGVYISLATEDAGAISAVALDANGAIIDRKAPSRATQPERTFSFPASAALPANPGAPPPPPPPAPGARPAQNGARGPSLRSGEWNYVEIAIRGEAISGSINGRPINGGAPLAGINQYGFAALIAAPDLMVKDVAFEDFLTRKTPSAVVGKGFQMRRVSDVFTSEAAAIADINKDGKPDIVAGPLWYEGPDFKISHEIKAVQTTNISAGYPEHLGQEIHDWNGDGWPDVLNQGLVGGLPIALYLNPKGENRHWEKIAVAHRSDLETLLTCDLFKSGDRQLITTLNGKLGWLAPTPGEPKQLWTFHTISDAGATRGGRPGPTQHGVGCGDLDNDGKLDVLSGTGWWSQPAKVSDAVWAFHSAPWDEGGGGADMYVYDVNGDGRVDVVAGLRGHGYGLAWFEQTRTGEWIRHQIMGSPEDAAEEPIAAFSELHAIALADIDGDGLKDIVTGKRWYSHGDLYREEGFQAPPVLYWFKLQRTAGKATFVPHYIHDNSGIGTDMAVGDVTGDGRPDIVTSARHGTFVFENRITVIKKK